MDVDLESTTQGTFFLPCKRRKRSPEPDDQQQQQPEPEPATPPAPALEAWTKAAYERSWAKHEARINVRFASPALLLDPGLTWELGFASCRTRSGV